MEKKVYCQNLFQYNTIPTFDNQEKEAFSNVFYPLKDKRYIFNNI